MASKLEYIVYSHKNKINGKIYVGQTSQPLDKRWQNGFGYKRSPKFFEAIKKYGWDNFEHTILKSHLTLDEANYWEAYYINYYNTVNNGYNLTYGGNNAPVSEETKQKLRESHLGYKPTELSKQKCSLNNKGKHFRLHTEEEKQKMSEKKKKKVICLNTGVIFNSITEAEQWCGLKPLSNIGQVCRGKRISAGKHPITKEPLKWKFVEEDE